MKKTGFIITVIFIGLTSLLKAQGSYEALLFSQSDYLGTARFMGAGGAFGVTGGDFSAVNTNPASIGLYKRSEVSITPLSLAFNRSESTYLGSPGSAKRTQYTFPQAGIVIASPINRNNQWRSWQFGFGYNRLADYNNTYRFNATTNSTMMDMVVDRINGAVTYNNLTGDAYLAWNNWLIDTFPGTNNQYYSPYSGNAIDQTAIVKRSGAIDEMTFTFGGNYADKLYIGATIGMPFLSFKEVSTYTEAPADNQPISGINGYKVVSEQRNSGAGINLKLGITYQPVSFMRIGVGFHTPTYFWRVRDNFTRSLTADYSNGNHNTDSYSNYFRFAFTSPLKFNVGASFIIMKRAFVAAEYEFQNYGMANLYADDYDFANENSDITHNFGISHNVRVGAEVNLTESFALRAGYRLKTSPYKNADSEYDNTTHYVSAGLGFKGRHFFGDLAYVYRINRDSYWIYDPVGEPGLYSNKAHGIVATVGYKF